MISDCSNNRWHLWSSSFTWQHSIGRSLVFFFGGVPAFATSGNESGFGLLSACNCHCSQGSCYAAAGGLHSRYEAKWIGKPSSAVFQLLPHRWWSCIGVFPMLFSFYSQTVIYCVSVMCMILLSAQSSRRAVGLFPCLQDLDSAALLLS